MAQKTPSNEKRFNSERAGRCCWCIWHAGGGFGCSVGGQSAIDQSTDKKNQSSRFLCVRERVVVFEGESAAYYGRLHQNMSLLRNGWFSSSRLFSVNLFFIEEDIVKALINKDYFLLGLLQLFPVISEIRNVLQQVENQLLLVYVLHM